jgi:hypothetical protein
MDGQWQFILKLLMISAMSSVAIKYGAPWLNIPATPEVALALVLSPSLVLGSLLLWRGWQFEKQQRK